VAGPVFRSLDDVVYGEPEQVSRSIRRVIAENPSKFTYRGTGTYIVGHGDVVVIDPGPPLDSHREALERALAGERVRAILVTHCHADHSPLASWLHDSSGAPTLAFGPHPRPDPIWDELSQDWPDWPELPESPESPEPPEPTAQLDDRRAPVEVEESTDFDFEPTDRVSDGELVIDAPGLTITAVHTPGHTSNHVCWEVVVDGDRALFTGDHVMGWSTTVVSPPDGDMASYIDSLRKVARRAMGFTLWPTHGPPRDDAEEYVTALVAHRLDRERGVLEAVRGGRSTAPEIVESLYVDVRPELYRAAARSVWGHLIDLVAQRQLEVEGGGLPGLRATYRGR
jgi:glyoxylase-like metal-dependent hydrolase (beta-lactamase superfamily II)